LNQGALIIGGSSTPTGVGGGVTSGPIGTGVLTAADGTEIRTDNTARTLANDIVLNGSLAIGGVGAGGNMTLNGGITLGNATSGLNVQAPLVTVTLGGAITGTGTAGFT